MTPRFVPFESMSDAEQREHLRDWHGCANFPGWHDTTRDRRSCHDFQNPITTPHTHDKPAPRPEENR